MEALTHSHRDKDSVYKFARLALPFRHIRGLRFFLIELEKLRKFFSRVNYLIVEEENV